MQIKKSRELDLERKKPTLFFLGLAVACAAVLSAFEWRTPTETKVSDDGCYIDEVTIEATIVPLSFRDKEKHLEKKADVKKDVAKTIIDDFIYDERDLAKDELEFPKFDDEPIIEDISSLPETDFNEEPLLFADIMPEFPGGDSARVVFLSTEVDYPQMAKDAGISGKVHIGFTVAKDGSIKDIHIKKGVGGGLDEEVLRAVEAMPKWNPGFNNGKPVNVSFVMPVTFSLK